MSIKPKEQFIMDMIGSIKGQIEKYDKWSLLIRARISLIKYIRAKKKSKVLRRNK